MKVGDPGPPHQRRSGELYAVAGVIHTRIRLVAPGSVSSPISPVTKAARAFGTEPIAADLDLAWQVKLADVMSPVVAASASVTR